MTPKFLKSLDFVLKWEGGYSNDNRDKGGQTKFGISARAYPNLDIKNLTLYEAEKIYFRDYWLPINAESLTSGLALAVFDFAVHSGQLRAVRTLQIEVGEVQDGIIGEKTLKAIAAQPPGLCTRYIAARRRFLMSINRKPFARGWENRLKDLEKVIESMGCETKRTNKAG
jgi:lysozyme family protein